MFRFVAVKIDKFLVYTCRQFYKDPESLLDIRKISYYIQLSLHSTIQELNILAIWYWAWPGTKYEDLILKVV